jgi:hypothetical protein
LPDGSSLVVYEWRARQGYLATSLFPAATFLGARPDDSAAAVLDAIPAQSTHFLFHLGATITMGFPSGRAELLAALAMRGIQPINGRVSDISKPFIQRTLAALALPSVLADRTMPPETPVIVKTSLNFGGKAERQLPPAELQRMGMHLASQVSGPSYYKIMGAAGVPAQWWDDPSLCIERYITNDENRWHRAIIWQDRLVLVEGINRYRIKKLATNVESRSFYFTFVDGRYRASTSTDTSPRIERVLAQLAAFVPSFGLQFGAIDVVSSNSDEPYIIDVNTTPYFLVKAADVLDHLGGALPRH